MSRSQHLETLKQAVAARCAIPYQKLESELDMDLLQSGDVVKVLLVPTGHVIKAVVSVADDKKMGFVHQSATSNILTDYQIVREHLSFDQPLAGISFRTSDARVRSYTPDNAEYFERKAIWDAAVEASR